MGDLLWKEMRDLPEGWIVWAEIKSGYQVLKCPFHTHTYRTHTHYQPGVLCRVTPRMSSFSRSSSPATFLQAECWLDADQPHASCSNEQYEPNGRAPGEEEGCSSDFTKTEITAVKMSISPPWFLFSQSSRAQIMYFQRCHISFSLRLFVHFELLVALYLQAGAPWPLTDCVGNVRVGRLTVTQDINFHPSASSTKQVDAFSREAGGKLPNLKLKNAFQQTPKPSDSHNESK